MTEEAQIDDDDAPVAPMGAMLGDAGPRPGSSQLSDGARKRVAWAVKVFWTLSAPEQADAFLLLLETLAEPHVAESPAERPARERAEALQDIGRVAAHLALPEGRAPTQAQYEAQFHVLGLRHRAAKIAELWNGRFRQATMHWSGRGVYMNARTRDLVIRARKSAQTCPADREAWALASVRSWLMTNPPRRTQRAYGHWRERATSVRSPCGIRSLYDILEVDFASVLQIACGEITLAEARERESAQSERSGSSPLVGRKGVTRILGISRCQYVFRKKQGVLPPALVISRTPTWPREDIEAIRDNHPVPDRDMDALRHEWLDVHEAANLLGCTHTLTYDRVCRQRWHLVPRPAQHSAGITAWRRDEVEAWCAARTT